MSAAQNTAIVAKIVELLEPLASDERQRVVTASMTLLGESNMPVNQPAAAASLDADAGMQKMPSKVQAWMKKHSIGLEQLNHVYHIEGEETDFIASMPGKNKKDKTYNAYVLTGLGRFIITGNTQFDDKSARALCEKCACYDNANHATHMSNRGNEFTGSKEKGWSLTEPGLRRAAELVVEIAPQTK